jgi:carboxylate-amine ligase
VYFNQDHNSDMDAVERAIAVENKWRAQRYGVHGSLASRYGAVTVADMLEEVMDMVMPDAEELGCCAEMRQCREIVSNGTSADQQLKIFNERNKRDTPEEALFAVSQWIAATTLQA